MKKYLLVIMALIILVVLIFGFYYASRGLSDKQINDIVISELTSYCSNLELHSNGSGNCFTCWRSANDIVRISTLEELETLRETNHHYYFVEKNKGGYLVKLRVYTAYGRATRGGLTLGNMTNLTIDTRGEVTDVNLPQQQCS